MFGEDDRGKRRPLELHEAKLKALDKILAKHKGEPVLVLTTYTHERDRVLARHPKARLFNEKDMPEWRAGKIPVWVASPQSMSHGIDGMQDSCRIAVWMTPTYSWETYYQTNARIVRTGQVHESIVYRILVKDTIDWAVAETLRSKEEGNNGAMLAIRNLQKLRDNEP